VQIRMVVRTRPGPDGPETAREVRRRVIHALGRSGIRATTSREVGLDPVATAGQPMTPAGRE
jgi:hypothetical protein